MSGLAQGAIAVLVLCVLQAWGCDRKSTDGESCTRTNDCETPLRCVSLRCVSASTTAPAPASEPVIIENRPVQAPTVIPSLIFGKPLIVSPIEQGMRFSYAQLALDQEGFLSIHARGDEPIHLHLKQDLQKSAPIILSEFGMDPRLTELRLAPGRWYFGVKSQQAVQLTANAVALTDTPPHNPPEFVPTKSAQPPSLQ